MANVSLIISNWGTYGGTATYHRSLVQALTDIGHSVHVCTPYPNEKWAIPQLPFPIHSREACIPYIQRSSTWIVWATRKKLPILLKRKRSRPTIVVMSHGDGTSQYAINNLKEEAPYADKIVTVSPQGMDTVPMTYRGLVSTIVPHVDLGRLMPSVSPDEIRKTYGISPENKVLLFLGRIAHGKRINTVLDIAKKLPSNWKVMIVGGVIDPIDPKQLIGQDNIILAGPTLEPGNFLQVADCFISPSLSEGFGLSVIEAVISGVPLVAHAVGVLKSINVGTLLPFDASIDNFVEAIVSSSKDKALVDKELVQNIFTYESFLESWRTVCPF